SGSVSVLFGNGDGTFRSAVNTAIPLVPLPWSLAAGDLNRDGRADLVVASSGAVVTLISNGDGTFQRSEQRDGEYPESVVLNDFNRDGAVDLAVGWGSDAGYGWLTVRLGNGDGTFQSPQFYGDSVYPLEGAHVVTADFNEDAILDLAVSNGYTDDVWVVFGRGDGTFFGMINSGVQASSFALGDLNGDGLADLAGSRLRSDVVTALLGTGGGTFRSPVPLSAGRSPADFLITDVDGDGRLDLIVANWGSNNVSVLAGNGDGTFQPAVNFAAGNWPSSVASADFNCDGRPDLAVTNYATGTVSILFNVTALTFLSSLTVTPPGAATTSTLGTSPSIAVGYSTLAVNSGPAPYATAVYSLSQNGQIVSEAGVPASPPVQNARVFVEYRTGITAGIGTIDTYTGLAIASRSASTASLTYTLRDRDGQIIATGHGSLPPNAHRAKFVHELQDLAPDFNLPANFSTSIQYGSLDISSNQPVSVLGLRLTINQRGEALLTSTSVADLSRPLTSSALYFPQLADGGGYTTTVILLNTSGAAETGTISISDDAGSPLSVRPISDKVGPSFSYSIPTGGTFILKTDGSPSSVRAGWLKVTPDSGSNAPIGAGVFSYSPA